LLFQSPNLSQSLHLCRHLFISVFPSVLISVSEGAKIVETAIKTWGRIDIVINNAGILRDVSFVKMTDKDWKLLVDVHLHGAYQVTKAAWPVSKKRKRNTHTHTQNVH
jgi:NAD(P)-dependent dehydrogenase (short-subunit alcohol dehydrogenase family)